MNILFCWRAQIDIYTRHFISIKFGKLNLVEWKNNSSIRSQKNFQKSFLLTSPSWTNAYLFHFISLCFFWSLMSFSLLCVRFHCSDRSEMIIYKNAVGLTCVCTSITSIDSQFMFRFHVIFDCVVWSRVLFMNFIFEIFRWSRTNRNVDCLPRCFVDTNQIQSYLSLGVFDGIFCKNI